MLRFCGLLVFCVSFCVFPFSAFAIEKSKSSNFGLPKFFTYLRAVDDSIIQEMRYYGSHNFLGRPVKGYLAPECILTTRAARALRSVQQRLLKRGLSLKVYDCYRPQRAVNDFVAWSKNKNKKAKAEFYPTLPKSRLFALGYIARRSGHSRGSTVDLSIVALPAERQPLYDPEAQVACIEDQDKRYEDNSLDFGTGFDCFHQRSHTRHISIGEVAKRNRRLLVSEMARAGFENYSKEWWHFSLKNEPFKRKHFDFPIRPFPLSGAQKKIDNSKRLSVDITKVAPLKVDRLGDLIKQQAIDETDKKVTASDHYKAGDLEKGKKQQEELRVSAGVLQQLMTVVCVRDDDVLNVRSQPSAKGKLVGAMPHDAIDVKIDRCAGDITVDDWHQLPSSDRANTATPWCKILSYRTPSFAEEVALEGWVSGAFLIPTGTNHRVCKVKK